MCYCVPHETQTTRPSPHDEVFYQPTAGHGRLASSRQPETPRHDLLHGARGVLGPIRRPPLRPKARGDGLNVYTVSLRRRDLDTEFRYARLMLIESMVAFLDRRQQQTQKRKQEETK